MCAIFFVLTKAKTVVVKTLYAVVVLPREGLMYFFPRKLKKQLRDNEVPYGEEIYSLLFLISVSYRYGKGALKMTKYK